MYLWDVRRRALVGVCQSLDEAARLVGAAMSLMGRELALTRFLLTQDSSVTAKAKVIADPHELYSRGLVYYNQSVYNTRLERKKLLG
jgi:hypothetical protein